MGAKRIIKRITENTRTGFTSGKSNS